MEINYLDLFSGCGGFSHGLQAAGLEFKNHYFSEIDKHAIANYKYNYPNAKYIGSVESVCEQSIRKPDIITFGWPCQDNSIAGKRKGQRQGTRSGLLFEATRIIEKHKPRHFIAENVKGLSSVNEGHDFYKAVEVLAYLSQDLPQYDIEMQLLNTSWFLPQNRERFYFVGHLRDGSRRQVFPIEENDCMVSQTRQQKRGGQLQSNRLAKCLNKSMSKGNLEQDYVLIKSAVLDGCEVAVEGSIIDLQQPNSKTRRGRVSNGKTQALDTNCNLGIYQNCKIRRLTEIECERLQGFKDGWTKYGNYDGTIKEISKTQRYKLCGNAVSKPVVEEIAKRLIKYL